MRVDVINKLIKMQKLKDSPLVDKLNGEDIEMYSEHYVDNSAVDPDALDEGSPVIASLVRLEVVEVFDGHIPGVHGHEYAVRGMRGVIGVIDTDGNVWAEPNTLFDLLNG